MPLNTNIHLHRPSGVKSQTPLPPWQGLKYNLVGLYALQQCLGSLSHEPGIFTRFQQNFMVSDIAWFAAGASEDGEHYLKLNQFHPFFNIS
jgi:hypothetical protein